jgi:hypothetical protein
MKWKTTAVLAVLLAGLGGFFLYDTYRLEPARQRAEQARGRLWQVEPQDITAVTLQRKAETVRLKRVADGGWEMVEPVAARADRQAVEAVLTTLVTARSDREIEANPARPADFGLDPPEARVTLEVKGRALPLSLEVGARSPTGAWIYAREGGKPAVLAVSETVGRDAARPAADLRDRTVLAFDRKSLAGIEIESAGERLVLEAREGGRWQITEPRSLKADEQLISDFLDRLEGARAKAFVEEQPRNLAPYGLDRPATLTLRIGRDKDRSSKALAFGRVDSAQKGVYVMRPGEGPVLLVDEALWTALPRTVAALRDKVVLAYAYDKVRRVELEHARGSVALERDGAGWKLVAPQPLKADTGAVNALLWAVRDLRATGFLAEEAAAAGRYLPRPEVTVRLWEEGATAPRVLAVAASRESRGAKPQAVAAVQGQGPVMLVDARALGDLSRTADDLRDRTLLPAFEVSQVKRARLVTDGKALVVERSGESDWRVLEPARGAARDLKVTDLLLALRALRWKQVLPEPGEGPGRHGLDQPQAEVTLFRDGGAEVATLLVGRPEGDLAWVQVKGSPALYAVDARLVKDLRTAKAEIPG